MIGNKINENPSAVSITHDEVEESTQSLFDTVRSKTPLHDSKVLNSKHLLRWPGIKNKHRAFGMDIKTPSNVNDHFDPSLGVSITKTDMNGLVDVRRGSMKNIDTGESKIDTHKNMTRE